jgi:hypothetical protein
VSTRTAWLRDLEISIFETRALAGSRSGLSGGPSGGTLGGQHGGSVSPWPTPTDQEAQCTRTAHEMLCKRHLVTSRGTPTTVRIRPFCDARRRRNAQRHDAQRRNARRPCHPDDDDTPDVKRKHRLEDLALADCFIPKSQTCNSYKINPFR